LVRSERVRLLGSGSKIEEKNEKDKINTLKIKGVNTFGV